MWHPDHLHGRLSDRRGGDLLFLLLSHPPGSHRHLRGSWGHRPGAHVSELHCFRYWIDESCIKLSFLFMTRYVPAVVAVGQYFSRRLSFATGLRKVIKKYHFQIHQSSPGLCVTGSGVGTFVFAPIASALVEWAGWRGCNRVGHAFNISSFSSSSNICPLSKSEYIPHVWTTR